MRHRLGLFLLCASCVSTPPKPRPLPRERIESLLGARLDAADIAILESVRTLEQGFASLAKGSPGDEIPLQDVLNRAGLPATIVEATLGLEALRVLRSEGHAMDVDNLWKTLCEKSCSKPAVAPLLASRSEVEQRTWFQRNVISDTLFAHGKMKKTEWITKSQRGTPSDAQETPPDSPSLATLKAAVAGKNWGRAKSLSEKVTQKDEARPCDGTFAYARFVDAQWARRTGKRDRFFELQRLFSSFLNDGVCSAADFEMTQREFLELKADGLLWTARLLWERDEEPAEAAALAERARLAAGEAGSTELLLEAAQVQIGRLGFERETPARNLELIENYARLPITSEKLHEWLEVRRAFFELLAGNAEKAASRFESLATAAIGAGKAPFLFWRGKALQQTGASEAAKSAFLEAGQSDPLSYYDVMAGEALGFASRHASGAPGSRLLKNDPEKAFRTLRIASEKSPHPFLEPHASLHPKSPAFVMAAYALTESESIETFSLLLKDPGSPLGGLLLAETKALAARLGQPGTPEAEQAAASAGASWILAAAGDYLAAIPLADRARNRAPANSVLGDALLFLLYPRAFPQDFREASTRCGVDENLLFALSRQESLFHPGAVSSAGAIGLMQLLPSTARRIFPRFPELAGQPEMELLKTPKANTLAGSCYLADLVKRYDGNLFFAIAAYNAGENAVDGWLARRNRWNDPALFVEFIPFAETQKYVQRVLRNLRNMEWIYEGMPAS